MDRLITLCAIAGSFAVALLSIFLGYRLFVIGAAGGFKFGSTLDSGGVGVESILPGIAFALFGLVLSAWTVMRATKK
jgi:hypothetical protein